MEALFDFRHEKSVTSIWGLSLLQARIPGFGSVRLEHLVSDFTGTLAMDGQLLPRSRVMLTKLSKSLTIHVLTSDLLGTVHDELKGVPCLIHIVSGSGLDEKKQAYVRKLGARNVVALGNGMNDRKMLSSARIGIVVMGNEGCSCEALLAADIQVSSVEDAFGLLLNPKRLVATLQY